MIAAGAVADGRGGFAVRELHVGDPGRGEVAVDLRASGICHTDQDWIRADGRPHVMGHEGAGVVAAVGPGVTGICVGDHALLTWAIACGRCFQCERGHEVLCEVLGLDRGGADPAATRDADGAPVRRFFQLGTMSTRTVVRAEAVVPMPPGIPFASACLLGCSVMTGWGSVVNAARMATASTAVVLGCGGVGLNVVQGARIAGARRIVAVDVEPTRLDVARRFGATDTVVALRDDTGLLTAAAQVAAMLGGRGADYAFECTGRAELAAAPLAFVRHGGTAVQVSGVEEPVTVDMTLFEWDKTYLNPLYGGCRPRSTSRSCSTSTSPARCCSTSSSPAPTRWTRSGGRSRTCGPGATRRACSSLTDPVPFASVDIARTASPDGLREIAVHSAALGRRADVTVHVPDGPASRRPLPLVILLHGVFGSHWSWARSGRAHLVLGGLVRAGLVPPLVLAMPSDGLFGIGSGYVGRPGEDAERWIVEEVPQAAALVEPRIDSDAIAIAGLSMGGWGALRLAARYPGRFRAAVGMSPLPSLAAVAAYAEEPLRAVHAPPVDDTELAATLIARRDGLPPLRISCGVDDALLPDVRALHVALTRAGVPHEYAEVPGGHAWNVWTADLVPALRFLAPTLNADAG